MLALLHKKNGEPWLVNEDQIRHVEVYRNPETETVEGSRVVMLDRMSYYVEESPGEICDAFRKQAARR